MSFLSTPISLFPVKPRRQIDSIQVDVILSESTTDKITITKQPVQQGANITDHAFKEPVELSMSILQAQDLSTSLDEIYKKFLDLQSSLTPFTIVTPTRVYNNMLMGIIGKTTDKKTENILALNLNFQEIITVPISTAQISRSQLRNPGGTGATQNVGKKSALLSLSQGIVGVFK